MQPRMCGGQGERHLNSLTDGPLGLLCLALSVRCHVFLILGVICEPEWANLILKFGICTLH